MYIKILCISHSLLLALSFSLHPCLSFFPSLRVCLSRALSISRLISLSLSLTPCRSLFLSLFLSLFRSLFRSLSLAIFTLSLLSSSFSLCCLLFLAFQLLPFLSFSFTLPSSLPISLSPSFPLPSLVLSRLRALALSRTLSLALLSGSFPVSASHSPSLPYSHFTCRAPSFPLTLSLACALSPCTRAFAPSHSHARALPRSVSQVLRQSAMQGNRIAIASRTIVAPRAVSHATSIVTNLYHLNATNSIVYMSQTLSHEMESF